MYSYASDLYSETTYSGYSFTPKFLRNSARKLEYRQNSTFKAAKSNPIYNRHIPFFVAAYLSDPNSTIAALPKEIIQMICTRIPIRFTYKDPFDQKGVLSWLRNVQSGLIDKENIICFSESFQYDTLSLKTFKWSTQPAKQKVSLEILGQEMIAPLLSYYNDDEIVVIDLQRIKLKPTCITISSQRMQNSDHFMSHLDRKLELFGSNDRISWEPILIDDIICKDYKVVQTYHLISSRYFRFFKISHHNNEKRMSKSILSGLEMYGFV